MSGQSLKLERVNPVPLELTSEDGPIGSIIDAARIVAGSKSLAAVALAERAQALIKNACPLYQPNTASKAAIMCASGRDTATPFRGTECCSSGCLVSQVRQEDEGFKFVGKRIVEDDLIKIIFQEAVDAYNEDPSSKRQEPQEAD